MITLPDQLLSEFTAVHDRINQVLEQATPASDLAPVADACDATYHGTFCGPGMDEPQPFGREEALEGTRKAIQSGNTTHIENRTIRMRSASEAVVFFERVFSKNGQPVARLFTVENWRQVDGAWKLMRETVEQVAL